MKRRNIANLGEGGPFILICKLLKIRRDHEGKFAVLRVKDDTKSNLSFRKFNLDALKKEMYEDEPVEVWKVPSKRIDVVMTFPSEEELSRLQKGVVICLKYIWCRSVPTNSAECPKVYELTLSKRHGGELLFMSCDDVVTCRRERLDTAAGEYPDCGKMDLREIRRGISFTLECEVTECWHNPTANITVLRVRDSTLCTFATRKYTVDEPESSDSFHMGGSHIVDIFIKSLKGNPADLSKKLVSVGPVVAVPITKPSMAAPAACLYGYAEDEQFQVVLLEGQRRIAILRRKLSGEEGRKKRKRR